MSYSNATEVFQDLENRFQASAAETLEAVFQFHITDIGGDQPADWVVRVENGSCKVEPGTAETPTVDLTLTEATWVDLGNGDKGALSAFMSGQIKAGGNVMLAQKLGPVFGFNL
ncbi:MAG: SCP2 sterol-binding domain-containing protein [Wenzhouxiangellaceae bacterium]|nr:SCP2 sterol-binding domain-containing protein [Wenzhouxiangellaceae bacterium]